MLNIAHRRLLYAKRHRFDRFTVCALVLGLGTREALLCSSINPKKEIFICKIDLSPGAWRLAGRAEAKMIQLIQRRIETESIKYTVRNLSFSVPLSYVEHH